MIHKCWTCGRTFKSLGRLVSHSRDHAPQVNWRKILGLSS